MNDHSSLHRAKANKEDEFYTKWGDISNELQHYTNTVEMYRFNLGLNPRNCIAHL